MKVMYIKYEKGKRHSTIKEGENIIMSSEKIIPLSSRELSTESTITYNSTSSTITPLSNSDSKINEKITDFFFDAIHKNYLRNKKIPYKMT